MKKKLFLNMMPIAALSVLPTIAISCTNTKQKDKDAQSNTQFEVQLAEYEKHYKVFNDTIAKHKKELEEKYKNIQKRGNTKEQTKQLTAEKDAWVKEKTIELQALRKNVDDNYLKLRNLKDHKTRLVKLIHTNDEHGRLVFDNGKYNKYSGMQGHAEILGSNFSRDLLLSAGDLIQGQPLSDSDKGVTISEIAALMNYNAVAVGNHEFDYGLTHLFEIQKKTPNMPFLSANIVWNQKAVTDKVKDIDGKDAVADELVFKPYIIKELASGIKVGIMGITTPDTAWTSSPKNSVHVTFKDPVQEGTKYAKELRDKGVNIVIALTHLGVDRQNKEWDSRTFANNVEGVDLVLDGHSHTLVKAEKINNTILTQADSYTKYLSELDIYIDTETNKITKVNQQLRTMEETELLGGTINNNKIIDEKITKLKAEFEKINGVKVFDNPIDFIHTTSNKVEEANKSSALGRQKQTNLGMFVADALGWSFISDKSTADGQKYNLDNTIAFVGGGSIRENLVKGPITRGNMFAVSPYGNRIAAVELKGDKLIEVIAHGAKKIFSGGFAQWSKNVKLNINFEPTDKIYNPVEESIKINDKAIDKNATYYLVTDDYILVGGDEYNMLNYAKITDGSVKLIFEGSDMLQELIKYGQHITKTDFKATENNPFGDAQIDFYSAEKLPKNVVVNHKAPAATTTESAQ
ncbi:Trifunctional nucleotide phosphoesterase protein YfkN precursor [Mycoplasmopsis bovigenitalium]|uniref:Trifunctional nucleotide phosphoesterase protein YfkN n=1 Tax=Mycoplasmopsis bovigenitalium TaxID=2112 RepID=A0A449A8I9_9BACT|nr:bifunctional UDP-sugar hydrolase/5'-nucleotidase [Mycoplasmopsis bovigenitalium]VEU60466.1 Trifunctional nucleotide phosphoesterase protein YfkN precursor [Mycoplasmopsis bovigenitalium]